jgi:hypothetical protein
LRASITPVSKKVADLLYLLAGNAEKYFTFIALEVYHTLSNSIKFRKDPRRH